MPESTIQRKKKKKKKTKFKLKFLNLEKLQYSLVGQSHYTVKW